jgi:nitroimidazol reductase NimA-like FMN-containing flavoprotein (pyridoxamine 5'-phosphate oxidase superfamily)
MEVPTVPAISPDLDARERRCVEEVLRTAAVAYLAMVDSSDPRDDPRPYVAPMNFAYEAPATGGADGANSVGSPAPIAAPALEGRLLLHTGPGRKARALAENPHVCVSVTSREQLTLGATPCDDGFHYESVVLEGRAVLLTDERERERALRAIVTKYDPEAIAKPFKPQVFAKTVLYAIEIETIGFKERPRHS